MGTRVALWVEQPAALVDSERPTLGGATPRARVEPTGLVTSGVSPTAKGIQLPVPSSDRSALVAIVIDDLGRRVEDVEEFSSLGIPITFSVLPFEHSTQRVVAALAARGAEYLCHLPMVSEGGADPGPGALTETMGRKELARATRRALDAVPGAVGVNHHMGSRLTVDERAMVAVMKAIKKRRLLYLDSKTGSGSVAYRVAREHGVAALERSVFLDGDRRRDAIEARFVELLQTASSGGAAVAIGHPYPETLEALRDLVPRALAAGFEFVAVSALVPYR